MLFKIDEIIDNKLSEKITTDSKWKQKLIEMEKDDFKSPIYSFICIALLIYIWAYQILLTVNNSFGYKYSLALVIITTYFFHKWYKKNSFKDNNTMKKATKEFLIITGYIIFLISRNINIENDCLYHKTWNGLIILDNELNIISLCNVSYTYLNIICFVFLSFIFSYSNFYHKFKYLYKTYIELNKKKIFTGKYFICTYILFLFIFVLILSLYNTALLNILYLGTEDNVYRNISYIVYFSIPYFSILMFQATYYLIIYKLAQNSK